MQLFYHPEATHLHQELFFDKEESRHIVKVLRKKNDDFLTITNGKGTLFQGQIYQANAQKCLVKLTQETQQAPMPYHLHLAVAPTKQNERFEWFLEKATEIGISTITPIICEHSERKYIKPARAKKILLSAMKQSLKAYLPELKEAVLVSDFIKKHAQNKALKLIAHCAQGEKKSLKLLLTSQRDVLILIGPEGDFALREIDNALNNNFTPISLSKNRLRTETAAIVACHSVAFAFE